MKHLLITTIAAVLLVGTNFADPIHDAADEGRLTGVQAELDKSTDVNGKDDYGWSPLHYVVDDGNKEIVELLIANDADVNVVDWDGLSPLDLTDPYVDDSPEVKAAKKEIANILRQHGGRTGEELALMPRLSFTRSPFGFTFNTIEGKTYRVESGMDLKKWTNLREIEGTGNEMKFIDVRRVYFPQHFYRVKVVE